MKSNMKQTNPVLAGLQVKCTAWQKHQGKYLVNLDAELAVISRGKPFIGIERPKGYRHQRAIKQCFWNAADAAMEGRGTYVEGFVITPADSSWPIHHAWLTLDGQHAIDQTYPNAPKCYYFGIPFSAKAVGKAIVKRGYCAPLLGPDYPSAF
jgi:hypothetical protein